MQFLANLEDFLLPRSFQRRNRLPVCAYRLSLCCYACAQCFGQNWLTLYHTGLYIFSSTKGHLILHGTHSSRVGKNQVFFKKPSPVGFFGFFLVFLGFLGFFGFFWVFCPDERVFRVFFSFTNTFRCIQTLNYNHSYYLTSLAARQKEGQRHCCWSG